MAGRLWSAFGIGDADPVTARPHDVAIEAMLAKEIKQRQLPLFSNATGVGKVDGDCRSEKCTKLVGVGAHFVRDAKMVAKVAPDLFEKVKAGQITLPQAKREVQRRKKRQEFEAKVKTVRTTQATKAQLWEIRQGDCMKVLASLPEGSARLVFCDPPYNIGLDYGPHYNDSQPADEFERWCVDWMKQIYRLLTDDGSFWLLVSHEWAYRLAYHGVEMVGFHIRQWITWYEAFGKNCTKKFNRCSRPLVWFTKSKSRFVFHPEMVTRPSDRQIKYRDKRADPMGRLWSDVWGIDPPIPRLVGTTKERIPDFPTQLPITLLTPIVGCASDPGDLVVDPFNGSGTTGEACIRLGRRYLGIEQNERFVELARMRLEVASGEIEK